MQEPGYNPPSGPAPKYLGIIYMIKHPETATESGDRPAFDSHVLLEVERLIADWDVDSGLTYRQLAVRLAQIFEGRNKP